jgi:hypothetical protein
MTIPRHIQKNLDHLVGYIPVPPPRRITPIELGLILTLIGIGVMTILPTIFPFLLG